MESMVFNSPKGFWRSLPEISLILQHFYSFTKLKHPKSSTFRIDALSFCVCMAQCHPSSWAFSQAAEPEAASDPEANEMAIEEGMGNEEMVAIEAMAADTEAAPEQELGNVRQSKRCRE